MKKLENPKWEERRKYLKVRILPALLEILSDFFGNEKIYFDVSTQRNGEFITVYAAVSDGYGMTNDNVSLHLSYYDSIEDIDRDYNKLAEFIKKYLA